MRNSLANDWYLSNPAAHPLGAANQVSLSYDSAGRASTVTLPAPRAGSNELLIDARGGMRAGLGRLWLGPAAQAARGSASASIRGRWAIVVTMPVPDPLFHRNFVASCSSSVRKPCRSAAARAVRGHAMTLKEIPRRRRRESTGCARPMLAS